MELIWRLGDTEKVMSHSKGLVLREEAEVTEAVKAQGGGPQERDCGKDRRGSNMRHLRGKNHFLVQILHGQTRTSNPPHEILNKKHTLKMLLSHSLWYSRSRKGGSIL